MEKEVSWDVHCHILFLHFYPLVLCKKDKCGIVLTETMWNWNTFLNEKKRGNEDESFKDSRLQ